MAKLPTVWDLTPHTRAKHELLVRYLGAWFAILGRYNGRVVFLDGFAGPGVYSEGEPGSPTLALRTLLEHRYEGLQTCEFLFLFNEQDPKRFESLKREIEKLKGDGWPPHVKVSFSNKSFLTVAEELLDYLGTDKQLAPTFAFLDPFGYKDVPIDLIARLMAYSKCELFVYFDFNSVNRFATAGVVDEHFEALFGTDEFKEAPPAKDPTRKTFLHDLYQRQLHEVCSFRYVQSFEMVNEGGRTGHYLFFCTRNLRGIEKMKEAMWKVAPGGDYRFSDLLDGQSILFENDQDTAPLQAALTARFKGQTVLIDEVENFTIVHTPYAKSHVKRKTLAPMQREGLISSPNQNKANTYPAGTFITFH